MRILYKCFSKQRNKIGTKTSFLRFPVFFACTTFHSFQLFTLEVLFPTFLHNLCLQTSIANLKVQTSIFFQGTSILQRYAFL